MEIKSYNSLPNSFVENHVFLTNLQDKLVLLDLLQLGAVSLLIYLLLVQSVVYMTMFYVDNFKELIQDKPCLWNKQMLEFSRKTRKERCTLFALYIGKNSESN